MYVIFPADEVVYLSYGRLIVVPANSTPGNSSPPIRTNSLSIENSYHNTLYNQNNKNQLQSPSSTHATTVNQLTTVAPPGPSGVTFQFPPTGECQPSTSAQTESPENTEQEQKPKKRSLKFNFNLFKRKTKKSSDQTAVNSRVRESIVVDLPRASTPPSEAFKKYCQVTPPQELLPQYKQPVEFKKEKQKDKLPVISQAHSNYQDTYSSKRSSSSSRTSKPSSLLQEDQGSKKSSKQSSSSSKSTTGKYTKAQGSPSSISCNNTFQHLKDSKPSSGSTPRKTSTPTNLSAEVFYPLSTSREKNLVEPSPEPVIKKRSSSFRLSFRRSKSPDVSSFSQPIRPERKKEKKPSSSSKSKTTTLERKLSFSDYFAKSRERTAVAAVAGIGTTTDLLPEVIVTSEPDYKRTNKSPVLNFFRRTPSPKNLGRDRTPNSAITNISPTNQFLNLHNTSYYNIGEDLRTTNPAVGKRHFTSSLISSSAPDKKFDTPNKPKGSSGTIRRKERA